MKKRLATALVTTGLLVFGGAAAYAASGGVPGHGHDRSSAAQQYGERPGKGCGDRNHVHTGPPGNPSNTACPPQSQHQGTSTTTTTAGTTATRSAQSAHRAKACRAGKKAHKHSSRHAKTKKAHRHGSHKGKRSSAQCARTKHAKRHGHAKHHGHAKRHGHKA